MRQNVGGKAYVHQVLKGLQGAPNGPSSLSGSLVSAYLNLSCLLSTCLIAPNSTCYDLSLIGTSAQIHCGLENYFACSDASNLHSFGEYALQHRKGRGQLGSLSTAGSQGSTSRSQRVPPASQKGPKESQGAPPSLLAPQSPSVVLDLTRLNLPRHLLTCSHPHQLVNVTACLALLCALCHGMPCRVYTLKDPNHIASQLSH